MLPVVYKKRLWIVLELFQTLARMNLFCFRKPLRFFLVLLFLCYDNNTRSADDSNIKINTISLETITFSPCSSSFINICCYVYQCRRSEV